MKAEYKYKKALRNTKKKNNFQFSILRLSNYSYLCIRIDVDRFVLLATTGKMLKTRYFS